VQLSKFRGTNASTTGTGLGLSIVRRLVDKMGGTLTVESVEDEGTTFFILLPDVEMADEGDQEFAAEALPDGSRQRARYRAPAVSSDPLRVLVVDDMPINVKVLTVLLKRFGVTCDTASSGAEALEKLKLQPFNWILTDMYMDGMSGVELAQAVRKNSDYANVRLGVVTADIDAIGDNKSFFDAFLSKPVDRQQVYQCLFGGEK
ncbi:MAG: response regulator, partial [Thermoguttaceae bacterium]|nr:response regulator [Thermoguttaceae bacterium]